MSDTLEGKKECHTLNTFYQIRSCISVTNLGIHHSKPLIWTCMVGRERPCLPIPASLFGPRTLLQKRETSFTFLANSRSFLQSQSQSHALLLGLVLRLLSSVVEPRPRVGQPSLYCFCLFDYLGSSIRSPIFIKKSTKNPPKSAFPTRKYHIPFPRNFWKETFPWNFYRYYRIECLGYNKIHRNT